MNMRKDAAFCAQRRWRVYMPCCVVVDIFFFFFEYANRVRVYLQTIEGSAPVL